MTIKDMPQALTTMIVEIIMLETNCLKSEVELLLLEIGQGKTDHQLTFTYNGVSLDTIVEMEDDNQRIKSANYSPKNAKVYDRTEPQPEQSTETGAAEL